MKNKFLSTYFMLVAFAFLSCSTQGDKFIGEWIYCTDGVCYRLNIAKNGGSYLVKDVKSGNLLGTTTFKNENLKFNNGEILQYEKGESGIIDGGEKIYDEWVIFNGAKYKKDVITHSGIYEKFNDAK